MTLDPFRLNAKFQQVSVSVRIASGVKAEVSRAGG